MDAIAVIEEGIERVRGTAARAVEGLDVDALAWQPDEAANSIAWLVWHLARVQDDHVADVAGTAQVWPTTDAAGRLGLAAGTMDTGFGHGPADVASVRPQDPDVLVEYLDAVTDRTREYLASLGPEDLDRGVDEGWDPPVTLGVRLVSVISDGLRRPGRLPAWAVGGDHEGLQSPRSRLMISFMISFDPAQIRVTRASAQARAARYSRMKP